MTPRTLLGVLIRTGGLGLLVYGLVGLVATRPTLPEIPEEARVALGLDGSATFAWAFTTVLGAALFLGAGFLVAIGYAFRPEDVPASAEALPQTPAVQVSTVHSSESSQSARSARRILLQRPRRKTTTTTTAASAIASASVSTKCQRKMEQRPNVNKSNRDDINCRQRR